MSTQPEADTPQGTDLEQRITAAESQPASQEEHLQDAPAAMPTAPEDPEEGQPDLSTNSSGEQDDEEAEALASAKNPERTKRYIEKLKSKIRSPQPAPVVSEAQNIFDNVRPPAPSAYDQVVDPAAYPALNQQQVSEIANQFVDTDGTVDISVLNRALTEANQRAYAAERLAQQSVEKITRYEESRQLQEAYTDYPQLDPQQKGFDRDFYDLVSHKLMVENYAKNGSLTLKQAADYISERYKPANQNIQKVKDEAVEEYKQTQTKRNQGPVESGRGQDRVATEDHEDLRRRSRQRGSASDVAVAQRLKNLGI